MKFFFFLTLIILPFILETAQGFTLNNSLALAFAQNTVKVNVAQGNCENIGIDEQELLLIISDAVNQYWNKSPTSRLKLEAGTILAMPSAFKTEAMCLPSTSCEPNTTLEVDSDILITCNNNTTNFTSSGILAVTVPNHSNDNNILGSLMMINDRTSNQFKNMSRSEKVSIIAHELGHAFGLGHSPVKDSLMYYATVDLRQSLGSDDIDGVTYLYPKQAPVSCASISGKTDLPKGGASFLLGLALASIIALGFSLSIFKTSTS